MRRTPPISPRALVIYSRVGGGHVSAAGALAEALVERGCVVRLVDAYVDCGRFPATRFPSIYAWLSSRHPRLWTLIYDGTSWRGDPNLLLVPLLRAGVQRLMRSERPDVVISVLPAVNGVLAEAAEHVEVVLTDWHNVHRFWVAPGVRHYTAPTESARADLVRRGAEASDVDVVGIPVRRQFATPGQRPRTGRFSIVASVGAEGSPRALRNVAALARAPIDAELIVVCGRNRRLRRAVERLPHEMPVQALGFVEDVASLMRAADLLVTKAGGVTLAEAFCCGLPVVVHDVVPGQEAGNLEYVLARGAASYAPTPDALVQTVAELAADGPRREHLAERGARLARPTAALEIATKILERL